MRKFFQFAFPAFLSVALFGAAVFLFMMPRMEKAIMADKRGTLRELVGTVEKLLKTYQADVDNGTLSVGEAQKRALQRIQALRYGSDQSGYFWINDLQGRILMHPVRPDLAGIEIRNIPDKVLNRLLVDILEVVNRNGAGYVQYEWGNPDYRNETLPKISYVVLFKPWNWVIGSGMYYDDAKREIASLTRDITVACFGFLLLAALLSAYQAWRGMLVMRENKQVLASLHHSEAKFRGISAGAHDGIVMLDADGSITFWNKAAEKIFGYQADEIMGQDLHKVLAATDQYQRYAAVIQQFRTTGAGGAIGKTLELVALGKNGNKIPVELSISALNLEGNWHAVGVIRDVSERQRAKAALQESEARFRALFKMAPTAMSELSLDGKVIQVNDRYLELLGYSLAEASTLEQCWRLAFPDPEYRERVAAKWQAAVHRAMQENAVIPPEEFKVTCKDGAARALLIGASLIGDSLLVNFLDITEREREQRARMETLALLRATLNTTPDGILVSDQARRVTQANRQFYSLWGIPEALQATDDEASLLSYMREQLVTPDQIFTEVDALFETDRKNFGEIRLKDGRVFEHYSSPMLLDGKKMGRVWAIRDITERKRSEAERQKLQEQLLQSQKLEAVGTLAGGIAHDFNNILGAIIGYTEMILAGLEASDPMRENLCKVLDAAQRSADLTRRLLAFARKQAVVPMLLDFNTSVAAMLKMLHRLIGENIELNWNPCPGKCTVKIDPSQIDQLLTNLCINARDAIAGVGKITITTETVSLGEGDRKLYPDCRPGEYVLLTVSDTGCGMDQETQAHIFEPFFTTKGPGLGTGLGMATVYGIVQQNEGFIHVYSEPAMGTTIHIYFPNQTAEVSETIQLADGDQVPQSRGEAILLVEDDPMLRQMGEMMLQCLGYGVFTAATPSEAIRMAAQPDLLFQLFITDVIMPEMNGRELADRLLAIRPGVHHLFMSGYTADVIVHHGVLQEGINFIQKPFSLKDMAVKIRSVLDQGHKT